MNQAQHTWGWLSLPVLILSPGLSFPVFNNDGELAWDSQTARNIPRTSGPVGQAIDQPCPLSLGPLALLPMLSWTGQAHLSEQMSRRVRALFGAVNFWAIIMYNLVSLNSLEFTELVARRLLLTGERRGWDTQCASHQPQGL